MNKKMLIHTLETLVGMPELEEVLVVSRDPKAIAVARELGARTVLEDGTPQLNLALTRATVVATTYAARGVLILPADLPQLTQEDVREMVAAGHEKRGIVIAPDHRGEGTNGLLVKPAGAIKYMFGEDSFSKHVTQAEAKRMPVNVCKIEGLAHDVDLPEDLSFLNGDLEDWLGNGECEMEAEIVG